MRQGLGKHSLVIGSGISGVCCALRLSEDESHKVSVISRAKSFSDNNTAWAQGGIITRGPEPDECSLLVSDLLSAGDGVSLPEACEVLAQEGPDLVDDILINQCGIQFDKQPDNGQYEYGMEGAHSARRIVHVGDKTGELIMNGLLKKLAGRDNVTLFRNHTAVDLITFPHHSNDPLSVYKPLCCHGAYVLDQDSGKVLKIVAGHTVLATGGLGALFRNTSNPQGARGDGLGMAWRAGARIINPEYIQFHPTTLSVRGAPNLLISEAVRGEGAVLLTPNMEPFMEKYSPKWKDLAPRDVVARAIHTEMVENGYDCVYLDIASKHTPEFIKERFPKLMSTCLAHKIDPTTQPIPVVPAAHYSCGGVFVDLNGLSTISGLYAVGEVSCTGVHGANRLASSSLLEGLVWGNRAAIHITKSPKPYIDTKLIPEWVDPSSGPLDTPDPALIDSDMTTIRNIMWNYVGLVRTQKRLERADSELRHLYQEIDTFYRKERLTDGLIGLRNALQVARIITHAARHNRESRGSHFRADFELSSKEGRHENLRSSGGSFDSSSLKFQSQYD